MRELGWREAIVQVLKSTGEPMHYTDIAEAIAEQGLRSEVGATPAATVSATISLSMQNEEEDSPFIRVSRGYYFLRDIELPSEDESPEGEEETSEDTGLISSFGMYWWRDKVLWTSTPRLLGQQQPGSTPVSFARQKGVYLLHDGRQVVYVGRTTDQTLGARLKQHTVDRLNGRWDRFSWFGVHPVSEDGELMERASHSFDVDGLIATMEALLLEGLEPPQNRKRGDDFRAVEFLQVDDPEIQKSQILELIDELKKKL